MRTIFCAVLFLAIAGTSLLEARASEGGRNSGQQNAAVKFLRADASLRQSYPLPPDAPAKLQQALQSPLTEDDEKLVAAAEEALVEFRHGAALRRCDWVMSAEDGALANTAHRGAMFELISVAGLRARLRFRDGQALGAIEDIVDAMAASRHLSVDGSLASVLFAYRLENALAQVLSANLGRLSPSQLETLADSVEKLPNGSSIAVAFEIEKTTRNDFEEIAKSAKSRDQIIEALLKYIPFLHSDRAQAAEVVDACGGSVAGFRHCVDEQQSFYVSWVDRFQSPPDQFERAYQQEVGPLAKSNALIREFTPMLPRFRWTEAYTQTRRALLRAAIAVRMGGSEALAGYPDPYDGKPFAYSSLPNGFRLASQLSENGTQLTLNVAPQH